jgi:hypothetical protein
VGWTVVLGPEGKRFLHPIQTELSINWRSQQRTQRTLNGRSSRSQAHEFRHQGVCTLKQPCQLVDG